MILKAVSRRSVSRVWKLLKPYRGVSDELNKYATAFPDAGACWCMVLSFNRYIVLGKVVRIKC